MEGDFKEDPRYKTIVNELEQQYKSIKEASVRQYAEAQRNAFTKLTKLKRIRKLPFPEYMLAEKEQERTRRVERCYQLVSEFLKTQCKEDTDARIPAIDFLQEFEKWLLQINSTQRGFSSYMVESCLQKDMMVVNLKKYYTGFSLINPRTTDFVYFLETLEKEGFAVARNNDMFQPYNNRLKTVQKSKLLDLIANGKHCEIRLNVLDNSHKCAFCEADGTCVDAITADGKWFTIGKECLSLAKCIVAFFDHLHHTATHMRECDLSDCIKTMNKLLLEIMKN